MNAQTFKGLTWDHPRGYRALEAAAVIAAQNGLQIEWERQPLEGFESHPIKELCARYDLVVMDHPHLGEAVELNCLQAIDTLLSPGDLAELENVTVGPCLKSYQLGGQTWALPLDAACQAMAFRADMISVPVPQTWEEVTNFAQNNTIALSLAGPHALLTCLSIAASIGILSQDGELFPLETGIQAFEILREIYALSRKEYLAQNPIELLQEMAGGQNIALCPLIFGYVNFTRPEGGAHALTFTNAPRHASATRPGSVLGGTGIGISKRCNVTPELTAHLLWLLSQDIQRNFIPLEGGQPCRRDAWNHGSTNAMSGNFYTRTLATIEVAHVRPRHTGFVQFQLQASELIRQTLDQRTSGAALIQQLNQMNQRLLQPGKAHCA